MKENVDKHLDDLAKKIIREGSVESPSFNFTNTVISQIKELNKSRTTVYKPLVSKKTWILISIGFLAAIVYILFFGNQTESTTWLSGINFSMLSNNNVLNTLSSFKISKTFMYAIVFFGLMICIQILVLKNHLDKRFEV